MTSTIFGVDTFLKRAVFGARGIGKFSDSKDPTRLPTPILQIAGIVEEVSKLDNKIGETARNIVGAADSILPGQIASTVISKASSLVNPAIVVASGVRVATSDNKCKTGCTEVGSLLAMFGIESLMKTHTVNSFIENNAKTFMDKTVNWLADGGVESLKNIGTKNKAVKTGVGAISALIFCAASVLFSSLGAKVGEEIYKAKFSKDNPTTNQSSNTNPPNSEENKKGLSIES